MFHGTSEGELFETLLLLVITFKWNSGQKCRIAHRDVKSANFLMKSKDEAVICDLGFAISQNENLKLQDYNVGTLT